MPLQFKIAALALVAGVIFGAGWAAHGHFTPAPVPTIKEVVRTEVETKTVDHIVTKTITVRVKEPSGKSTETVTATTSQVETAQAKRDVDRQSVASVPAPSASHKYMIGADWTPRIDPKAYQPAGVGVGYRIGGPVWGTASYEWINHTANVGLRTEW